MSTVEMLNQRGKGFLPALVGIEFTKVTEGMVSCRLEIRQELMAPNGYLHAATVIAVADTACGYGTVVFKPAGAHNFTTVELKCNFVGTVRDGAVACEANLIHSGRTTQVWDARVFDERSGRNVALFRCTQILLYPETSAT